MGSTPIVFDGDSGLIGRFVQFSTDVQKWGALKDGCVHVIVQPSNTLSFSPEAILNVPRSAIVGPIYSTKPRKGVVAEGYIFLLCSTNNESDLFDALSMEASKKMKELHLLVKESKIAESLANLKVMDSQNKFKELTKRDQQIRAVQEGGKQRGMPFRRGEDD